MRLKVDFVVALPVQGDGYENVLLGKGTTPSYAVLDAFDAYRETGGGELPTWVDLAVKAWANGPARKAFSGFIGVLIQWDN